MSITNDQLETAVFPREYAELLMDLLRVTPASFLGVKDALYHFRNLADEQAAEVIQEIASRIEAGIEQ
jgi:hypothetical protein